MTDTIDAFPDAVARHEAIAAAAASPAFPDGAHIMPSGNWVALSDPRHLTRGDKKNLIRAASSPDADSLERGFNVTEGLLARLVTAWSYPHPIPAEDRESMDLLPAQDDSALMGLVEEARMLLFPPPASPDDYADERSPTEPSAG